MPSLFFIRCVGSRALGLADLAFRSSRPRPRDGSRLLRRIKTESAATKSKPGATKAKPNVPKSKPSATKSKSDIA